MHKDSNAIPKGSEGAIVERMAEHVAAMMQDLNLDLADPNFEDTPRRVAEMYLEMFHGLREGSQPKVTSFPNDGAYHHMVIEKEIPFYSMCAHHFVPFYGHAHIAYIPESRIVGLSKLPRILEFYAKRPQLQERLTEQVAEFLWTTLQPQGDGGDRGPAPVRGDAGVKKPGAMTNTLRRGLCRARGAREFLALLRRVAAW
jgi:GTP cyclohydrolase I